MTIERERLLLYAALLGAVVVGGCLGIPLVSLYGWGALFALVPFWAYWTV